MGPDGELGAARPDSIFAFSSLASKKKLAGDGGNPPMIHLGSPRDHGDTSAAGLADGARLTKWTVEASNHLVSFPVYEFFRHASFVRFVSFRLERFSWVVRFSW
jgi:hypothetical protein